MGDNIYLGDRNGVRTPMQWSPDRNAGFSRSDPQRLYLPPIMDSIYGYEAVNVEAQTRDHSSLLNWMKRVLAVRQSTSAFGRGRITFLRPGNRKILAYVREYGDDAVLCVANLARSAQPVELDLTRFRGRVPVEMLGRAAFPPVGELPYLLTLPAHGFYWFRLAADAEVPHWHEERLVREDLPVLVLFDGWNSLFRDRVVPWRIAMAERTRSQLEREVLPRYLESQRWYSGKADALQQVRIADQTLWSVGSQTWMIALLETEAAAETAIYFVPFALVWEDTDDERKRAARPGDDRQGPPAGAGGRARGSFGGRRVLPRAGRRDRFRKGDRHRARQDPLHADFGVFPHRRRGHGSAAAPQAAGAKQQLRRHAGHPLLSQGVPAVEAGNERRAGDRPLPDRGRALPVLRASRGLARIHECGGRAARRSPCSRPTSPTRATAGPTRSATWSAAWKSGAPCGSRLPRARTMRTSASSGRSACARPGCISRWPSSSGDPAFDPEPADRCGRRGVEGSAPGRKAAARWRCSSRIATACRAPARDEAQALLAQRERLLARIDAPELKGGTALKIRCHGDYHLGQVLIAENDFRIIDFEGEPARPAAERRQKQSPLRDVAGMLRSFSYARWTALANASHAPDDHARLAPLAAEWEAQVRRAFVESYDAAVSVPGAERMLYSSLAAMRPLIELFELEKALYELRYELSSRPAWVRVPLHGIRSLLGPDR